MRVLRILIDLDHLVRFYQMGFVSVWPLLGLVAVSNYTAGAVVGLLAIVFFFNTYGVVLDDALHVDIDRRDPLRYQGWVVRGKVTPAHALTIALLQIPLMLVTHVAAGFPLPALVWLAGAITGMTVYDLFGKTLAVPLLTELAQAACAFLLVLYGAAVAGKAFNHLIWPTAAAGAVFMLLVNGFHGSLRDLDHEITLNQRTVAIWLGCRRSAAGAVHISSALTLYSGLWQAILLALPFVIAFQLPAAERGAAHWAAIATASATNVALFVVLHRIRKPAWDLALRAHTIMLMVPTMIAFSPLMGAGQSAVLFAAYLAPSLFLALWWSTDRASTLRKPRISA